MKNKMYLFLLFSVFIVFFLFRSQGVTDEKPDMLIFLWPDCEHCERVKKEFLPGFIEKYGQHFSYIEMDASNPVHFDLLQDMESRIGIPEEDKDSPAVYFLGTMLEGEIPVRLKLSYLVEAYISNPDSMLAIDREVRSRIPEKIIPKVTEAASPVSMAYFYKQGCKECGRAEEIINWLKNSYPFLSVYVFNIGERRSKLIAAALGMRAGMPEDRLMSTPAIFIGSDYVLSEEISRKKLAELVETYAETGAAPFWNEIGDEELQRVESKISELFSTFTFFAVLLAGLVDGINPCAFASILFFVSYLGMIGRKRREILIVGLSFAFAVFITYFMVGLGFFKIINSMAHFELLSKIIFGATGAVCILFGVLSIGDYFKARSGKTSEMALQLPAFLKRRIHKTIREKTRMKSYVAGALVAGFLVSILEFACTGQVYLPTIIMMVGKEGARVWAIFYLLLYNLSFIVPLLVVFGFVYFGVSSKGIAKLMEARVGAVKLALATVFFVVGGLLFWTAF
ncbi:cytochrome c biogenesis CcdA family protein [Candidatus Latescibacterota bacterium]